MRKAICLIILIALCILSGCSLSSYDIQSATQTEIQIPMDAPHMAGQKLILLEKSKFEEADKVYYAQDEEMLAKVIQYAMDNGIYEIAYQSDKTLEIDETAEILSMLNPFDIILSQSEIRYTNVYQEELYTSHHITIQIPDTDYKKACAEAKRRVDSLISETMSTNTKIKRIHDDIIIHSVYDEQTFSDKNAIYQAYGVLINGKGVCSGYSRAFMVMAQYAGIQVIYVSSETMNHGWNYVYDGVNWRYIDVTWDDPLPDQGNIAQDMYLEMNEQTFLQEGAHILSEQEQAQVQHIAQTFF